MYDWFDVRYSDDKVKRVVLKGTAQVGTHCVRGPGYQPLRPLTLQLQAPQQ
jgi:hypothetical protein